MLNNIVFHFSTYRPSLFKHLSHRTVRKHQLRQSWHRSSQQHAGQVVPYLINNAFSAASKLRTPNVYCWSRKTLVAIHRTLCPGPGCRAHDAPPDHVVSWGRGHPSPIPNPSKLSASRYRRLRRLISVNPLRIFLRLRPAIYCR